VVSVLIDVEHREELPTPMPVHHRVSMHRNGETALAIHKSNNPIGIEHDIAKTRSFLLIVRTGRIITFHIGTLNKGCDMNEYRRILGCSSIQWGFLTARYKTNRYSYGRRLPGLRFTASSED